MMAIAERSSEMMELQARVAELESRLDTLGIAAILMSLAILLLLFWSR